MNKRTEPITIHVTPHEKIKIRKLAGKELLGMSPFCRKALIEKLNIKVEDET